MRIGHTTLGLQERGQLGDLGSQTTPYLEQFGKKLIGPAPLHVSLVILRRLGTELSW
jgi:hypothetical protein